MYERRAQDLNHAVLDVATSSGALHRDTNKQKLCWATRRDLLRIFVEHQDTELEMLCNIMNTFHRFSNRRTLGVPRGYGVANNFEEDGLLAVGYQGTVYANPPYDGHEGRCTVVGSMDIAEQRALSTHGFRGVFVVP